jgi:hypothetical protein
MILPDQTTSQSIAASTATVSWLSRRLALLVVCLPLLLALGTLASVLAASIPRRLLPFNATNQALSGPLSQDQARVAALAKQYCARLTGATCNIDPADVTLVSIISLRMPARERSVPEWNVYGRAGASRCFLSLDPDTKTLRVFTCESAVTGGETSHAAVPSASSSNGDIGVLSGPEQERYARLYLARASIVLPRGARLVRGTNGIYRLAYHDASGPTHHLRVFIDSSDGRLLLLENLAQQQPSLKRAHAGHR